MRAGGFPGNPGGLVVSIVKTAGARAPAHQARGRGRRTWRPTERTAGARMVPPGEGNEARGDGRRGVGVSHSTAEAGELSPRDPVEGRGHRQVAPLEGKTANTPRLGPVSTSRQRIAELARHAVGMAVAIAWLPGPAGTRRRVAKLSVEEPDAAEPARPDLWGARVSNDPGLPDLMARLAQRVSDRRLLELIGRMLKAKVVMPDGVVVSTQEGVPQGGPLSPLLSNIVLDELDQELDRRGHRFVRYADDCNVYVRSERAGQRAMASVTRFIERRLRLKVNRDKSAVARTEERHVVGFVLKREPMDGDVEVLLSTRSKDRIDAKIVELTPRNWGNSLRACIRSLNVYLLGWIGFFGSCTAQSERTFAGLDAHIRRRLRAIQLKHWKRKRTVAQRLVRLGVRRHTAWRRVYQGRE